MMKHLIIILLFISISIRSNSQQLKTYDIVNLSKNAHGKAKIIYITGLWCQPCMSKLKPLMDTFSNRKDIDFIVLFDRYGMTEKSVKKLSELYDTAYFALLPEKYYPVEKSHGVVSIKLNAPKKTLNALATDYNVAHQTNFTVNEIWLGVAFLQKGNKRSFTKESDLDKLIDEIHFFLTGSN